MFNRLISCLASAILFLNTFTFAQIEFNFSGYAVELPVYSIAKKQNQIPFFQMEDRFLNLSRLRLRPVIYLWDGARINLEHETNLFYSNKESILDFITNENRRQLFELKWQPVKKEKLTITHFIDRFYLKQEFDWGDITIGRQRISWGSGRIWNPTDMFNPISSSNFSKIEKDGADALTVTYFFGSFTDLNIVFNPQRKLKNSNGAFRFRTNFYEYDAAIIAGYFDNRMIAGLDFAGNFFDAGLRAEGILSVNENDGNDKFYKFILGLDNQFTSELYGLIEYHYNGEGKFDKLQYEYLRFITGEIINLGQNYLAISANYLLTPLLSASISNNINLDDKSGFAGLTASYSLTGNLYVHLGLQYTYGDEYSEYWLYPHSIYFQAELHF
jgi:hypothetical protein